MPVMHERPKMTQTMYQSLKRHILRQRQKEAEMLALDATNQRLRAEREEMRRQTALSLQKTEEEVKRLEKKLDELRKEKTKLFNRFKEVSAEESSQKERQKEAQTQLLQLSQQFPQYGAISAGLPAPQLRALGYVAQAGSSGAAAQQHAPPQQQPPQSQQVSLKRRRSPSPSSVASAHSSPMCQVGSASSLLSQQQQQQQYRVSVAGKLPPPAKLPSSVPQQQQQLPPPPVTVTSLGLNAFHGQLMFAPQAQQSQPQTGIKVSPVQPPLASYRGSITTGQSAQQMQLLQQFQPGAGSAYAQQQQQQQPPPPDSQTAAAAAAAAAAAYARAYSGANLSGLFPSQQQQPQPPNRRYM